MTHKYTIFLVHDLNNILYIQNNNLPSQLNISVLVSIHNTRVIPVVYYTITTHLNSCKKKCFIMGLNNKLTSKKNKNIPYI